MIAADNSGVKRCVDPHAIARRELGDHSRACGPSARGPRTHDRRRRSRAASRACRASSTIGRSSARSARSSRVPCRNSSGPRARPRGARPARCRAVSGGMQRKPEEHDAAHVGERLGGMGARRHAAAERLAAGEPRQRPSSLLAASQTARDRAPRRPPPYRAAPCPPPCTETPSAASRSSASRARPRSRHERMTHASARAVREHVQRHARRAA